MCAKCRTFVIVVFFVIVVTFYFFAEFHRSLMDRKIIYVYFVTLARFNKTNSGFAIFGGERKVNCPIIGARTPFKNRHNKNCIHNRSRTLIKLLVNSDEITRGKTK